MSDEEKLLLWVFHAINGQRSDVIHHTYAFTEAEAWQQEFAWINEQTMLGFKDITVKHWPGGFRPDTSTYWPGSIPMQPGEGEVKP